MFSCQRTFRCDFEPGGGHVLSTEKTEHLKTELIHDVIFTEISLGTGSALQILPTGETPLMVLVSGVDTVHFLEAAPNGSLTLTTVFLKTKKEVDGGGYTYPVSGRSYPATCRRSEERRKCRRRTVSCKGVR